jgi:hypothetical protein
LNWSAVLSKAYSETPDNAEIFLLVIFSFKCFCLRSNISMVSCASHWNGVCGLGTKQEAEAVTFTDFPLGLLGLA